MKLLKKLFSFSITVMLIFSMLPAASADSTEEDYFKDRSWDDVIADFFVKHNITHDRITLGYYNTVTGEEHYYQPDKYMLGASVYKVPLNMAYAEKIYNGEMDWDSPTPYQPYEDLMYNSIVYSDNEDSGTLMFNLGGTYRGFLDYIAPYLGVDTENVDPLYYNEHFTARQYVTCLKTLYHNSERFPNIIETMKLAEPNHYFRLHEQRYEIAHKYGYWPGDYFYHINDVGIVFTDDPIVIVMFTASVDNAYEVMTDYCTVMCDYTNYHREQRLIAEAEAKAQAKKLAEEEAKKLAETLPTVVPEAEQIVQTLPAETEETEEDSHRHSPNIFSALLGFVLTVIAAFLAIAAIIHYGRKGKINAPWALAAVIISAAAMLLCLLANSVGVLVAKPDGDPQETVTAFFDALSVGNYDEAYSYLDNCTSLGLENEPADPVAQAAYAALRNSYEYDLFGNCSVDKLSAVQQLQFSCLDLKAIQPLVQELTVVKLEELVMSRPASEIYDENRQYLPSITMEAYSAAVNEALKSADKYYNSSSLHLQLEYKDGRWLIIPSQELLKALMGGSY